MENAKTTIKDLEQVSWLFMRLELYHRVMRNKTICIKNEIYLLTSHFE